MKMMTTVCASLLAVFLIGSSALAVEHQIEGQKSMGCCQGMQQGECGCEAPMMGRGMGRPEMMGMPMTDMMCSMMHQQQMMGGRMGPGGMGMMEMMSGGKDPKAIGRMLQMRGEMLKAIGEVLLKYGSAMAEEGK